MWSGLLSKLKMSRASRNISYYEWSSALLCLSYGVEVHVVGRGGCVAVNLSILASTVVNSKTINVVLVVCRGRGGGVVAVVVVDIWCCLLDRCRSG